jgi:feruloyl esterase
LLPPTEGKVDRSRPVFPYPLVARYTGKGSVDDAASFVEAMPEQPPPETFEWYGSTFFAPGYQKW